jgi:hypothetical protein
VTPRAIFITVASIVLLLAACSGDKKDNVLPDQRVEVTDVATEVTVDSDLLPGDGEVLEPPACTPVKQGVLLPANSGTRKFALSLFHYNLQYVAGGLVGFLDTPEMNLTDVEVQDRIIVESFFPMIEILENHPTWGMDAEMQGLMVEAIAERHAGMLPRIKALVQRGQLHIDSFHYSDQLWVAYPLPSMTRSFLLNEEAFAGACLPVGGAVFTQEGQFGHGLAHHIRDSGRTALYPTNLFKYFSGNIPGPLAYDWDGTTVVVAGKGVSEEVGGEEVEVTWHFMNDGELAFTGNANPYFGSLFAYDKKFTEQYVEKLEQLEADGWTIATVADYVAHLEQLGYESPQMPLALDGAWQPKDTQNVLRWMGQVGELGGPGEDDNGVLTGNVRSRMLLQAAEAAAPLLELPAESIELALKEAWYHQLLAEVSDSTGWNPWPGEVKYSKGHSTTAAQTSWALIGDALVSSGSLMVDTATGELANGADVFYRAQGPDSLVLLSTTDPLDEGPTTVTVQAPGREAMTDWFATETDELYLLQVTFGVADSEDDRFVRVAFPRFGEKLSYVPALMEEVGEVTEFDVTEFALDQANTLCLGLANGLLGLGNDQWLVKVESTIHLAAIIPRDGLEVRFENHSQPVDLGGSWSFFYLDGASAEAAVAFANRINVTPVVELVPTD